MKIDEIDGDASQILSADAFLLSHAFKQWRSTYIHIHPPTSTSTSIYIHPTCALPICARVCEIVHKHEQTTGQGGQK